MGNPMNGISTLSMKMTLPAFGTGTINTTTATVNTKGPDYGSENLRIVDPKN